MNRVYILGGVRSYIGVENGMYRHIPAEKLGASVLKELMERWKLPGPDLIIAGNAVGAGGNMTRLMLLETGLSGEIPAFTVDSQCGSGLESIALAAAKIKSGQADLVIAGGFDSSSTAPRRSYSVNHPDYERYGGEAGWYSVAKFMPGEHRETEMLEGAERTAVAWNIRREQLDRWVLRSHRLALQAAQRGWLKDVVVKVAEGCERDEGIRERMSQRLLDRLPCVLKDGQVLTAANSCLTHDGAAFLVLCSQKCLDQWGWTPKGEFLDVAEVGCDPKMCPEGAVLAVEKLLQRNHLTEKDIDVFECNEAFAVIDELFARRYPGEVDKYNILGGALAYGHPYGASGGIIALHGLTALDRVEGNLAVCSIAAAGGVGTAVLLKRIG